MRITGETRSAILPPGFLPERATILEREELQEMQRLAAVGREKKKREEEEKEKREKEEKEREEKQREEIQKSIAESVRRVEELVEELKIQHPDVDVSVLQQEAWREVMYF